MRKVKKSAAVNVGTFLLNTEENNKMFELLGDACTTRSTTVIQLYKTEHPYHNRWFKQYTGVLCFVRDTNFKRYFLRLYCFESNTLLWEFAIPPGFEYVESASFMHEFCGTDCVYGFNFADESEAKLFYETVKETAKTVKVSKRNASATKIKKQQSTKRKKPQKPVISNPVAFRHVQHYGFNDWRDLNTEIDRLRGNKESTSEVTVSGTLINVHQPLTELSEGAHYYAKVPEETEEIVPLSQLTAIAEDFEETSEMPQTNFLTELNSKFGTVSLSLNKSKPRSIINEEFNNQHKENESSQIYQKNDDSFRQAMINRQRVNQYEDGSDTDYEDVNDDEWD